MLWYHMIWCRFGRIVCLRAGGAPQQDDIISVGSIQNGVLCHAARQTTSPGTEGQSLQRAILRPLRDGSSLERAASSWT